ALLQLSKQNDGVVPALSACLNKFSSPRSRANVVWALTRITAVEARAPARTALVDSAETVKHAAIQSIALWRDKQATRSLVDMLPRANPALQRVIAEALGRLGDRQAVPALLAVGARAQDRVLEHSLIYALI